jgi:protein-L-isoaspartate(D-aspartate) O-methyltransferase
MQEINFLEQLHKKTKRDYTERIIKFDKAKCAEIACNFGQEYWDGDRQYGYGGYRYMEGYWQSVAESMIKQYKLNVDSKILDIGCGKGFLMYEFTRLLPGVDIVGIDISEYAVRNAKDEVRKKIQIGSAVKLPFNDDSFDFAYALGCMHNLHNYELFSALQEMERVSKQYKYTMQESYRTEVERINMCNWQLTQHTYFSTKEWVWFMQMAGYKGDYGFIFFE